MERKNRFLKIVFLLFMIFILVILLLNIFNFIEGKIHYQQFKDNINKYDLDIPIYIPIIDPSYDAQVFLFRFLESIVKITEAIGMIFIGTLQDIITILFSGKIFYNAIGIQYVTYFKIVLGIFFFFLIVFLGIKFFKIGLKKNTNSTYSWKHVLNSFVLLIMIILLFQILFLSNQYILEKVFGIQISKIDLFSKIQNLTIGKIDGNIMNAHNETFYFDITFEILDEVFIKIDLEIFVKTVTFSFTELNVSYILLFIFTTWFILIMLMKFVFKMIQRIIDITIFGFAGLPFVAASTVEDGGKRLNEWNSIIFKKAFSPFFSLFIYLLLLISIDGIFNIIDSVKFSPTFSSSSDMIVLTLKIIVINGIFLLLNKFSYEWADKIVKVNNDNNIQEFINISSSNQKNINYAFDENFSFTIDNSIIENTTKYTRNIIPNDKNKLYKSSIDINETLEKIERKEI